MQINPYYTEAYLAEGLLLSKLGQLDGAIYAWNVGLTISPLDKRFEVNISKATALKERNKI